MGNHYVSDEKKNNVCYKKLCLNAVLGLGIVHPFKCGKGREPHLIGVCYVYRYIRMGSEILCGSWATLEGIP
jgi:hypothetical protein